MQDWLYYQYNQRMWVCFAYVIDDCKTVEMTDIEMTHAFLGLTRMFACGANGAKEETQ